MSKTMDKREFFDSMAADWDGHPEPEDASAKRTQFVALATEGRPSRILDVGCGRASLFLTSSCNVLRPRLSNSILRRR